LTAKANELNGEKAVMFSIMDEAKAKISSLTGVWISAAADEFQNRFKQIYDDIDNMFSIVTEYVQDLTESAGVYANAEQAAQSAAQGLPTDGVFRA
jgi:uncharacterized protein YukE